MPKVSVIIPTYNCARYLGQAIESVMNQTYRDVEIIVVDDGSTDETSQIMDKYGANVHYIRQDNRGMSAARNRAIDSSSGELIALLDADDWWEPTKLEEQVSTLAQDPDVCLVYSDLKVVHDDGSITPSFLSSRPMAASGYIFDQLLENCFILPSTVLLWRTCLDQVGMFDETMRSHEDIDLWLRMCQRWKVALIPKSLTYRRQGSTNVSANANLRAEYGLKLCLKALSLPNINEKQRRIIIRQLGKAYFSQGYLYFTQGNMKECRDSLAKSLRCGIWNSSAWIYYIASFLPTSFIGSIRMAKKNL